MKMSRQRSFKRSFNQSQVRKRIFKLSISQIRSLVQNHDAEDVEYLDEYNTDMDNFDGDDFSSKDEVVEDRIYYDESSLIDQQFTSPFLDLEDKYIITIYCDNAGKYHCQYEPPRWMTSRVNSEYKQILNNIVESVGLIAEYFEKTQQAFLVEPDVHHFVFGGKLTQKNFVKEVNCKNQIFDEIEFSLVKENIWLVWSDKSFQISCLFN